MALDLPDIPPSPSLSERMERHEVVMVANVHRLSEGKMRLNVLKVLKGDVPPKKLTVAHDLHYEDDAVPKQGCGSVAVDPCMTKGNFLLSLQRDGKGFRLKGFESVHLLAESSPERDPVVRAAEILLKVLQEKQSAERAQLLENAWDTEEEPVRRQLVDNFCLARDEDPSSVGFLVKALTQGDAGAIAPLAGYAIWRHEYREAIPELLAFASKNRASKSISAVVATLAYLQVPEAYDLTVAFLDNPSETSRETLILALGRLEKEKAAPLLLAELRKCAPQLRPTIVRVLARMKVPEAIPLLVQMLKQGVCTQEVVRALGEMGPMSRAALPLLDEMASKKTEGADGGLRRDVDAAIKEIKTPGPDFETGLMRIEDEWKKRGKFDKLFHAVSREVADQYGTAILPALMERSEKWEGEECLIFVPLVVQLPAEDAWGRLASDYLNSDMRKHRIYARDFMVEIKHHPDNRNQGRQGPF